MTITISWQQNGDLTVSCGDDELIVSKQQLEKKLSKNETAVVTFFPAAVPTTDVKVFPKLTGKPKVCYGAVRTPSQEGIVLVETIYDIEQAITRAVGGSEQPDHLCLGWNSKEAIPIDKVNSLIAAEPAVKFGVDLYPHFTKIKAT